jgi:hypothetical protein
MNILGTGERRPGKAGHLVYDSANIYRRSPLRTVVRLLPLVTRSALPVSRSQQIDPTI